MPRFPFVPTLAAALVVGPLLLAGCGSESPYIEDDTEATEGTGETPDGAVNRSLDPGDAGTVGPANLDGEPDGDEAGATTEGAGDETMSGDAVTAKPVSYEQFLAEIDAADGPVLVDVWGTWCPHCKEAFPHTVDLAREHAADGLKVMALAFDTSEKDAEIARFLKEKDAGMVTSLRTDDGGDGEQWSPILGTGAFPILLVFNAEGEQVALVNGVGDEAKTQIDDALANVLGG